ncbi:MAG: hypothetical protein ACR2FH_08595 [Caulobacteraceae bacterium]
MARIGFRVTRLAGAFAAGGHAYRLEAIENGWWRLRNRPGANPPDFDFHRDHADETLLSRRRRGLQTDPGSMFVRNLVCQRPTATGSRNCSAGFRGPRRDLRAAP